MTATFCNHSPYRHQPSLHNTASVSAAPDAVVEADTNADPVVFSVLTISFLSHPPVITSSRPKHSVPGRSSQNHNNLISIKLSAAYPDPSVLNPGTSLHTSTAAATQMSLINVRSLSNKSLILNDFILTHNLDFLFLTETWQRPGDVSSFSELCPPNFKFLNSPRTTGRGGGLAMVFKENFNCKLSSTNDYTSFESMACKIERSIPVLCVLIYRPPKFNKSFIEEFSHFLSSVLINSDNVIILGDFNIHVCCPSNPLTRDFLHLIESFNLTQSVTKPTHMHGHTLDLILTSGLPDPIVQVNSYVLSDHWPIMFSTSFPCEAPKPSLPRRYSRSITPLTASQFSEAFSSTLISIAPPVDLSPEEQVNNFNHLCRNILDSIAPLRLKKEKIKTQPWFNSTTCTLRQECRRAERKWKRDKLQVSFIHLRQCLINYQKCVKTERAKYFSEIISRHVNRPKVLFDTINKILKPPVTVPNEATLDTCELFLTFFINKISSIRSQIVSPSFDPLEPSSCSSTLTSFVPISLPSMTQLISLMTPSSCSLDTIPPHLFKEVVHSIGPSVLSIINSSLVTGYVPSCFKHAIIHPLIKKENLDPSDPGNYRPISKLSFISKILEKVVFTQLTSYLDSHGILDKFQSGFRKKHSTESALLRVLVMIY